VKPLEQNTWQDIELGGLLREPGSARQYRTGDWRSQHPVWTKSRCIRCGVCWTVCPEPAIIEEPGAISTWTPTTAKAAAPAPGNASPAASAWCRRRNNP
jgi:pyruvate ferredoxin oxidoreductase delta subunit